MQLSKDLRLKSLRLLLGVSFLRVLARLMLELLLVFQTYPLLLRKSFTRAIGSVKLQGLSYSRLCLELRNCLLGLVMVALELRELWYRLLVVLKWLLGIHSLLVRLLLISLWGLMRVALKLRIYELLLLLSQVNLLIRLGYSLLVHLQYIVQVDSWLLLNRYTMIYLRMNSKL